MSCENPKSFLMNFALAMRRAASMCSAVKIVTAEATACQTDCDIPQLETLFAGTMLDDGASDVSFKVLEIASDSTPQNFFECGNKEVSTIEALMKCFTLSDDEWILQVIRVGSATCEVECNEIQLESEIRKRIYTVDGCVGLGIADAVAEEFECNQMDFTPGNMLSSIMGVDTNGNPVFRVIGVDFPEDTCLLNDLTGALYNCGAGSFAFLISRTGSDAYFGPGYSITYEESVDNVTFTALSTGGNKSAIMNNLSQYIRITIVCLEDDTQRVITLAKAENATTFHDYLKYFVDGILKGYVPLTTTIYAPEIGVITLQSLSDDVNASFSIVSPSVNLGVQTSIDIENDYSGPIVVNVTYEDVDNLGCIGGTAGINIEWIDEPEVTPSSNSYCSEDAIGENNPTFSVTEVYDSYQWYKDGVIMPGETNQTLNLGGDITVLGDYYCIATKNGIAQQSNTGSVVLYELPAADPIVTYTPPTDFDFMEYNPNYIVVTSCFNIVQLTASNYTGFSSIEWVGISPAELITPTSVLLDANSPFNYVARLIDGNTGCSKDTPGFFIKAIECAVAAWMGDDDSGQFADVSIVDLGGGLKRLTTDALGAVSGHVYGGGTWYRLWNNVTGSDTPVVVGSGLTVDVDVEGVYGYAAADPSPGGVWFGYILAFVTF